MASTLGRLWPVAPEMLVRALAGMYVVALAHRWLASPDSVGVGDWDWVFSDAWMSAAGFRERGWPPIWSVQISGGAPLRGDPQSLSFSPLLALPLLFGPIVGVKLVALLAIVAGLVGCDRLGLRWLGDPLAAAAFATAFVLSGTFAIHLRVGHLAWAMFYLVPWILLLADRVITESPLRRRDVAGLVAVLVLLFSGPVYQPLVFFLGPVLAAVAMARWRASPRARLRLALGALGVAVLVTMPRWIAVIEWQSRSPREVASRGGLALGEMARMLFVPIVDYRSSIGFGRSGIWESWCFTGAVAGVLAALSLVLTPRVRALTVSCVALGALLAWRSPWGAVVEALGGSMPLLLSVRVYARFLVVTAFGIVVGAGAAIAALRARGGFAARVAVVFALGLVAETAGAAWPFWKDVFPLDPRQVYADWDRPALAEPYSEIRTPPAVIPFSPTQDNFNSRMLPLLRAGYVVRRAYSALVLPPMRVPEGPVVGGEPPRRARIRNHRIDLWSDFQPGQLVVLRLRYLRHYNWVVEDRRAAELYRRDGDLAVRVLRPCTHLVVRLRTGSEIAGWACAALGLAATAWLLRDGPDPLDGESNECVSPSSSRATTAAV